MINDFTSPRLFPILLHYSNSLLTMRNARCLAESSGITNIDEINQPLLLANIYAMENEGIDEDELTPSRCRKCCLLYRYDSDEEEEQNNVLMPISSVTYRLFNILND